MKNKPEWGSKKKLHAALKKLRERVLAGQVERCCGICYNLSHELDSCDGGYRAVEYYSPSWPKYSGRASTPVPGEYSGDQFWIGDQLRLRLSLINHMIRKTR